MSIITILVGIAVVILLGGTFAVASAIPFVCGAFAFCFWGSLVVLAAGVAGGAVAGIAKNDSDIFGTIAGVCLLICLCGLAVAAVLFVLAFFVDGARAFLSILGLDAGLTPITTQRMFFPWSI